MGLDPASRPGQEPAAAWLDTADAVDRARLVRILSSLLLALVVGHARPGQAQPTTFPAAELSRLERGEVLTRYWREKDAGAGWAVGVINAPPEKVFAVIADVERYREFMYRMEQSRVVERSRGAYHFYYKIDMPWPLADYWCITRNVHEADQARQVFARRWTLVSGTFHRNEGAWVVRPFRGGRSLLSYSVVLLPKTAVPSGLLSYGTKTALPRSVRQLRERVEELLRAGRL